MRYATVQTQIWRSQDFRSLSEPARNTYYYLMTSPHSNMAGYYYLPFGYVTEDMQKDLAEVHQAFAELIQREHIAYDPVASVVLIKKHFVHNPINGPKQAAGAMAAVRDVPKSALLWEFISCAKQYSPQNNAAWDTLPIPSGYRIDTLSDTLPHTPSIPVISNPESGSDHVVVDGARAGESDPDHGAPGPDFTQKSTALDFVNAFNGNWYLTGLPWDDLLDYGESLGWLLVVEAVKRTAAAGSKNINYCLKVLTSWSDEGLTSVEKVLAAEEAWGAEQRRRERSAPRGSGTAPRRSNVLWTAGEKKPPDYYDHIFKKFDKESGQTFDMRERFGNRPDHPSHDSGSGSESS